MPHCTQCGNNGRNVKRITLESLLRPDRRADIGDGSYHVCLTPDCGTVYFGADGAASFDKSDLSVRFGLKETAQPRPVCYCFDHSVEGIHGEIRGTGQSTVLDSIKAAMKGPGCRCEYTNPMGCCCLRSVEEVVEQGFRLAGREDASARRGGGDNEDCCVSGAAQKELTDTAREDCCPTFSGAHGVEATRHRAGVVAAGGSVLAAIFSSACCWLPLVLIAFGVSAAGVAGFFEAYRPYLITGALMLLSFGYYTVYFRRETCASDSACTAPNRRLRAFSRIMLWTATGLVGAFVFFPNYVGHLFAAPTSQNALAPDARLATAKFQIEGMTCEGCASGLRATLAKLPNVASVEVDYPTKTAVVRYAADSPRAVDQVVEAVKTAGFSAAPADDP
ncbi:MAG: cation transporter [Phycisphaerae bacterium]|nr:cation transporter [Phycisphaerae bacterium]